MGRIDTEAKEYLSDTRRFADVFNYLIYDGQMVIEPDQLLPLDPTEIILPYGNDAREPIQKVRDLLKRWKSMTDGSAIYTVFGIELEAEVNYAMPVKTGVYDFIHYAKQVEETKKSYRKQDDKTKKVVLRGGEFLTGFRKEDKLMPVITLVFYLGDSRWDGPTGLREMLATRDKRILDFVPDYRINLIDPFRIREGDFNKFRTGVGQLLEFIRYSKEKEKLYQLVHESGRFLDVEVATANLINTITGSNLKYEVKEEKVNMCLAIDEMRQDSINEGRAEGIKLTRLESIKSVMAGLKYTPQQAMELLQIPEAERKEYCSRL